MKRLIIATLLGLFFSLPAGFGAMLGPGNPEFSPSIMFISTVVIKYTSFDAKKGNGEFLTHEIQTVNRFGKLLTKLKSRES